MTHTWYDLADHFCARRQSWAGNNPYFEKFAARRYNYANQPDTRSVRLVFLKNVGEDPRNKTLIRDGRFIWCRDLTYEGLSSDHRRQISFTIGKGKKRFLVSESDVLCLPSSVFVNNNSYMRNHDKVFSAFSSVFTYDKAIQLMYRNNPDCSKTLEEFENTIQCESPYQPGALVAARCGYFMPDKEKLSAHMREIVESFCQQNNSNNLIAELLRGLTGHYYLDPRDSLRDTISKFFEWSQESTETTHPYGIILGKARENSSYAGKELYRVNFGGTIYERVHPVQMEIISEV